MPILFHPPLSGLSPLERVRSIRFYRGLRSLRQFIVPGRSKPLKLAVIAHLEKLLEHEPSNWLLLYLLGGHYVDVKSYRDAIRTLKEAQRLRPRDPRLTYALATTFQMLTWARYVDKTRPEVSHADDLRRMRTSDPLAHAEAVTALAGFAPAASSWHLDLLGLSIDDAAAEAMDYLEETLRLGVPAGEEKRVRHTLEGLYAEFPHVETRVKNRRKPTGFFGEARKGSAGVLNDAVAHYTRLRFLFNDLPRFRFELGEVIRLCQWAIALNDREGDAYVLLANAYSLLDTHVADTGTPYGYYRKWAAAVIQHWADTPLRNYPFTKNVEIGDTLRLQILKEVQSSHSSITPDDATAMARQWAADMLQDALSPASFAQVKEQLEQQPL